MEFNIVATNSRHRVIPVATPRHVTIHTYRSAVLDRGNNLEAMQHCRFTRTFRRELTIENRQWAQNKRREKSTRNSVEVFVNVPILAGLRDRSEVRVPKMPNTFAISVKHVGNVTHSYVGTLTPRFIRGSADRRDRK